MPSNATKSGWSSRNGTGPTSPASPGALVYRPDPEVSPTRRRYPMWYKLQVLKQTDACVQPGQLGALLRREGLFYTTLTHFRRQRAAGLLDITGTSDKKKTNRTGRNKGARAGQTTGAQTIEKAAGDGPSSARKGQLSEDARRVMELEKQNRNLRRRLQQTEALVELQKKVAQFLAISLGEPDEREETE